MNSISSQKFPSEKKEAQLTERKFANNNNNKYKKPDLPNGKKKTENHIEVSISHLSRSLIITYWNYFIDRRAVNVSGITIPESFSRHLNFKDDLIQSHLECEYVYLSPYIFCFFLQENITLSLAGLRIN